MCMSICLLVCMLHGVCVCSAHIGQKRALDFLELELQVIMNHHVGAGSQI